MCMVPSIKLFDSDRAAFIDAHNYAELATQKVSAGLSVDDVRLKSAADWAVEGIRQLKSNPPDKEYAELFRWLARRGKIGLRLR
jgi:hypothetical protein